MATIITANIIIIIIIIIIDHLHHQGGDHDHGDWDLDHLRVQGQPALSALVLSTDDLIVDSISIDIDRVIQIKLTIIIYLLFEL